MTKKQLTEETVTEELTNETDDTAGVGNPTPETVTEGVTGEDVTVDTSYVAGEDEAEDVERGDVDGSDDPSDAETFPREYVEKLRKEAADARVKAKRADDLAVRLHTALVAATGRLADPSDLPFDEAHLEDADALSAAVDALVSVKPHLASRRPFGAIGQGVTPTPAGVDLAGILRAGAR